MKTSQQKKLLLILMVIAVWVMPRMSIAQIQDDIGTISPALTSSAVFYTSVYVSDTDENGGSDMLIGLAQGDPGGYSSFSCIVRFVFGNGVVEAHNGSGYAYDAANPVPMSFDSKYEVWFEIVDVTDPNGKWNPWVKGPGMESPVKILASEANFRAKGITQIDTWKAVHQNAGDDGLDVLTIGQVAAVGDRPASYDEASIAGVTFDPAGLVETWDPETTEYTAVFPFGTSTVDVAADPVQHGTSISGIGSLDVSAGSGQLTLEATSESEMATKSYTVDWSVTNPQKDATLSSLTVDVGDSVNFAGLSPVFGPTTTEYTITVPYGTEEVIINAVASAGTEGASVSGGGALDVSSGTGTATITVTSADASETRTYTVDVTVEGFRIKDMYIDHVSFSGDTATTYYGLFEVGVNSYVKTLPQGTISMHNLVVETNDPNSTAEFPGSFTLTEGVTDIQVRVISGDVSESITYNIKFEVEQGAAGTETGAFDPPLSSSHVLYTKISAPAGGEPADGLFALSDNYMTVYGQFSAGFRFVDGLPIQIHLQGSDYTSSGEGDTLEYDVVYHCWLSVNMPGQTYSVYVQKEGDASHYVVGENSLFRNSGSTTATRWGAYRNTSKTYFGLDVMKVEEVTNVGDIPTQGSDATLAGISLSSGTLNESFDGATLNYTASVPFGTSSVGISAEATDPAAFITGDSTFILDELGQANAILNVVSDDESQTQQYTVSINSLSETTDATLASITTDVGDISPAFNPFETAYVLEVPFGTATVNLTAETNVTGATVTGAGEIAVGADAITVDLVVTATDETTTKTYSVVITPQGASSDASLLKIGASVGTYDKTFDPGVFTYELTIPFGTEMVNVTSVANDPTATITGGGQISMAGKTTETTSFQVTAADGVTTSTYTINIVVAGASSDSSLSGISLSVGELDPTFASATLAYTVDVPFGTTTVAVDATSSFAGKTVVTGDGDIDVSSGSATATIVVTAEDLSTTTYTVEITVLEGSTDASLLSLSVENGTLEPAFDPEVFEYISVVPLGTSTANIDAVLNDSKASIKGAGSLDVISGSGTANIVVTAENGEVSNTYKVDVYVGSKPQPMNTENLSSQLEVYPNPARTSVYIDLGSLTQKADLTIFNMEGRAIYKEQSLTNISEIDVSGFIKGMYIIQVESKDVIVKKKIVKVE